jgi:FAD/FMN-containing dehydrogenase
MSQTYQSWNFVPKHEPAAVHPMRWRHEALPQIDADETLLPFGMGKSYGDSCQNSGGHILDARGLDRFIAFDAEKGILRVEAGVTLDEILRFAVPQGWFLAVLPGTMLITVGGAIANDIHGKNHHVTGAFGCTVNKFELLRSDGKRLECSAKKNVKYFKATIGGLGLTGLITWAEIQLQRISSPFINAESIKFRTLPEFHNICQDSEEGYEYTVAWIDFSKSKKTIGRGHFMRGNHAGPKLEDHVIKQKSASLAVPFKPPISAINSLSISAFNWLYFNRQKQEHDYHKEHYSSFFCPLDGVADWNRIYGLKGFFQYQIVVPIDDISPIREAMQMIAMSGQGSFLAVLKSFGSIPSPGILSFPRRGFTLAVDIPNRGKKSLELMNKLDEITFAAGGALYPGKDARMSPEHFTASYPDWQKMLPLIDPKFSSDFWKRVTSK